MAPTQHAEHGGSGAKRWMACPGSIAAQRGIPDPTSEYAILGTAAHQVGEWCLEQGTMPEDYLGVVVTVEEEDGVHKVTVDQDMVDAVTVYVNHVVARWNEFRDQGHIVQMYIEHQFDLAKLGPAAPLYGTSDLTLWVPEIRHLEVIDYKHGQGVQVDAEDNPQLRMYALGAVTEIGKAPRTIRTTIVQPRGGGDQIRSEDLTFEELVAFKKELFAAVERTLEPDAPRVPGDHCRFCRAAPRCSAKSGRALAVVQADFLNAPVEKSALPVAGDLTDEQLAFVLENADTVRRWLAAVEEEAERLLLRDSAALPGWKLVESTRHRRWVDEEAVDRYLRNRGLKVGQRFTKKLISPSQAEKLLAKTKGPDLPKELYEVPSGKPTLARADDKRTALAPIPPQDAFAVAAAPTTTNED